MTPEDYNAALASISDAMQLVIVTQSRVAATNLMTLLGDKQLFSAGGFILATDRIVESVIAWLIASGFVELTPAGLADDEELARHLEARLPDEPLVGTPTAGRGTGEYL